MPRSHFCEHSRLCRGGWTTNLSQGLRSNLKSWGGPCLTLESTLCLNFPPPTPGNIGGCAEQLQATLPRHPFSKQNNTRSRCGRRRPSGNGQTLLQVQFYLEKRVPKLLRFCKYCLAVCETFVLFFFPSSASDTNIYTVFPSGVCELTIFFFPLKPQVMVHFLC